MGPLEEGGCPFTHFDDQSLTKLVKCVLPEDEESVEVIIHNRKNDPNGACKLLFKSMNRSLIPTKQELEHSEFQNPVQYYFLLKDAFKNNHTTL